MTGPVATSVAHVVSPDGMDWFLVTVMQSSDAVTLNTTLQVWG
jgi:hypothetical protein